MTTSFPCLASVPALLNATPQELAFATLHLAFADQLGEQAPRSSADRVFQRAIQALAILPFEFESFKWFGALGDPQVQAFAPVIYEGILYAEQRLCLWREAPFGDSSGAALVLLRRGRMLLSGGDPATYLG